MYACFLGIHALRHGFPLFLALLILGLQPACLKSPAAPPVQEPTTITLSTYRIVFTAVNEHTRIDATVLDQDSRVIADATVNWRSADNSVARVTDRGVVTAAGSGTTQITVSSGYATATATVSVEQVADSIEITPSSITLSHVVETGQFTAVVYDSNNRPIPDAVVVWSSSNPEIATVDANGLVTAVSRGPALITASSGGVSTSRPVNVEIPRLPSRIVLNISEATLSAVGQSLQMDAEVYDSEGAPIPGAAVTWSSSDPEVATVDAGGMVIAVSNGTTRVTATLGGASAHALIHVVIEGTEPPEPPEPPIPSIDRDALIAFYHATGGPNWTNNTNWLSEQSLGVWYGVGIFVTGRVSSIRLDQNRLSGEIPSVLAQLDELMRLTLKGNDLTGPIPRELGQLSNLSSLELTGNRLSGPIPPELGALSNLGFLELDSNRLSGEIPAELGNLSNLKVLDLEYNTGLIGPLPLSLTGLDLTDLLLHTTQLCVPSNETFMTWLDGIETKSGITFCVDEPAPSSDRDALIAFYHATDGPNWNNRTNWLSDRPLGEWHGVTTDNEVKVIELDLLNNNLAGTIPPEIGQLRNLRLLDLTENRLSGPIPPAIGQLRSLERLVILRNQLSGEIPPEIGQLGNLSALLLESNRLSGSIPSEIGNLKSLRTLWLSNNRLSGAIPREIGNLQSLGLLSIGNNQLSGAIPQELWNLKSLTDLSLNHNGLTGEIPSEIGNLKFLNWVWLNRNEFTGGIPSEIGNLNALVSLHLGDNRFSGSIPPEFGRLTNLEELYLNTNKDLVGPLPVEMTSMSSLSKLELNDTGLCVPSDDTFSAWLADIEEKYGITFCADGPEPPQPEPLSDRDVLIEFYHATDGSNWTNNTNWLSDAPIGTWYGVATYNEVNVTELQLNENSLQGMIPPEIGQLSHLRTLRLFRNSLSGPIPPEIGQLGNLKVLNLGQNQLTGSIPPEIGMLAILTDLFLEYNQISGAIPVEIGRLGNLEWLVLRSNELTGTIPTEILALEKLSNLWLNHNRLTGPIPPEIGQLTSLVLLSLQNNQFEGSIPPEIGKLTNLKGLDISANELTGSIPPEIGQLTRLTHIELFDNRLTGPLPPEMGKLTELSWLFFSHNDFTGSIPPEFGRLTNLKQLILTRNPQMSGPLPLELVNVPLERLKLKDTQLCAPLNAGFQTWLAGIEDSSVENCASMAGSDTDP